MSIFLVEFGEIEISSTIVTIIVILTLFTFLAVGISSFKLIQSAVEEDEINNE